jgi:hypothetical protein
MTRLLSEAVGTESPHLARMACSADPESPNTAPA